MALPESSPAGTPAGLPVGAIDIISDAICPWCWIGKRQLERALALLEPEGLRFDTRWHPFQLNPDMPPSGRDRAAYRAQKFGSAERSAELDRRVADAGAAVGLDFRFDRVARTPNTVPAHRLIRMAGKTGHQDAVVEHLFAAYFTEGQDIGDATVLREAAEAAGLDGAAVTEALAGEAHRAEVLAEDQAARRAGLNGVPSFLLDRHLLFSGAVPAEDMAEAFRRAHAILKARAAG
jgi:predicted DsbA family dithiol-disulfide isomerase